MQKVISWFLGLFRKKRSVCVPKGYVIFTAEGGRLHCTTQQIVSETLTALYGVPINRNKIKNAIHRHNGKVYHKNQLIATIKYRKDVYK